MGLIALLTVMTARKLLIASSIAVAALIALAVGVLIPKQYEAKAKVQVDSLQRNLLTGLFEPRVRVSEFLGQQAAIASSRTVALQVIDTLIAEGFFVMADFEDEWRAKTDGELIAGNDARLWAADQVREKLEVRADALASSLSVHFRSEDPAQASRIANAFAFAYMQFVLDQRQQRAARNATNFSDETRDLEIDLNKAQGKLAEFRSASGIVALGPQRLEGAEVELASVTLRLAEARADQSEANSLLQQARAMGGRQLLTLPLPGDAQSGRQAQARLGGVLAQLQRLSERYDEQYPDHIEAVNEKRALERTIMRAVVDRAEYADRRVRALQTAVSQQKVAVVDLQETKQRYGVLEDKVAASRETYDLVATRALQESLQSRVDFVEVRLLERAVPSVNSITPPLFVIVLIGAFVGCGLGAVGAISIELVEGRLRSKDAVAHALRAPVLAEIALPPGPKLRRAA